MNTISDTIGQTASPTRYKLKDKQANSGLEYTRDVVAPYLLRYFFVQKYFSVKNVRSNYISDTIQVRSEHILNHLFKLIPYIIFCKTKNPFSSLLLTDTSIKATLPEYYNHCFEDLHHLSRANRWFIYPKPTIYSDQSHGLSSLKK